MKNNIKTIKKELQYHWQHQDKVSFDVLKEKLEGFERELRKKLKKCEKLEETWGEPTAEGETLREILGIDE